MSERPILNEPSRVILTTPEYERLLRIEAAVRAAAPALEAGARGCELIRNYRADLIGRLSPELLKEKAGEEFEYTDHAATLRMLAALAPVKR